MENERLSFLATTCNPECRLRLDKYLEGYYTLQFMERGGVMLAYDDDWSRLEGSWFWPAYPGPRLRFHPAPGYDHWWHRHVGFKGPLVQRWIAEGLWPTRAQPAPTAEDGRNYPAVFDELIAASRRVDHWGWRRAVNLLEGLLIELAEARAQSPAGQPWLGEALRRMTEGGTFGPNYARIAAEVGMGLSTFRRRFKEATGLSPHTYLLQARIAEARALLTETELSLQRIAERLGYDNLYYFARQFKEQAGVTPGQYRRSRQL